MNQSIFVGPNGKFSDLRSVGDGAFKLIGNLIVFPSEPGRCFIYRRIEGGLPMFKIDWVEVDAASIRADRWERSSDYLVVATDSLDEFIPEGSLGIFILLRREDDVEIVVAVDPHPGQADLRTAIAQEIIRSEEDYQETVTHVAFDIATRMGDGFLQGNGEWRTAMYMRGVEAFFAFNPRVPYNMAG